MKHEWRKKEKAIYFPKRKPEIIDVPAFNFITISGKGNPNSALFGKYIGALYSIAYTIKMNLKKAMDKPQGYMDWTVYPLEGVWDISDEAKKQFTGVINKDDLVFKIMIRQPDFITTAYFEEMLHFTKNKKPNSLLSQVKFETIKEGKCIQMLHIGPYDDEPESFEEMEIFAKNEGYTRLSKIHREIYLSDFRKVPPEKLKTVLRFNIIKTED